MKKTLVQVVFNPKLGMIFEKADFGFRFSEKQNMMPKKMIFFLFELKNPNNQLLRLKNS